MAKRDNHYEAAFEAWLRERRTPYVAVDETRRSLLGGEESLKNLDFVVSPGVVSPGVVSPGVVSPGVVSPGVVSPGVVSPANGAESWLVDVKGRRFPSGRRKQYWKNWSTRDELQSLARWEQLFGPRFTALLVFAYQVVGDRSPVAPQELFAFRGELYGFLGLRLDHYSANARTLSPRWDTVMIPAARFRSLATECGALFGATRSQRAAGA